jgi:hypothetical protein
LAKQTCGSLQNFVMLLGLNFIPPNQIGHMSLNGSRRQVETIDKTQTETRMHEPPIALDPEHWSLAIGALMLSFCQPKNHFLEYLQH